MEALCPDLPGWLVHPMRRPVLEDWSVMGWGEAGGPAQAWPEGHGLPRAVGRRPVCRVLGHGQPKRDRDGPGQG